MSVYQSLMLMLTFGGLVATIVLGLVGLIISSSTKK